MARVVIVGAGPAGLFAANELAESFDVVILEMRNFVGGSGLHSDGKLNFSPVVGGNLLEFLSEGESWSLLRYIEDVFSRYGVRVQEAEEEKVRWLIKRAIRAGIRFIPIRQAHIGSDELPQVVGRIAEERRGRGAPALRDSVFRMCATPSSGRALRICTSALLFDQ